MLRYDLTLCVGGGWLRVAFYYEDVPIYGRLGVLLLLLDYLR